MLITTRNRFYAGYRYAPDDWERPAQENSPLVEVWGQIQRLADLGKAVGPGVSNSARTLAHLRWKGEDTGISSTPLPLDGGVACRGCEWELLCSVDRTRLVQCGICGRVYLERVASSGEGSAAVAHRTEVTHTCAQLHCITGMMRCRLCRENTMLRRLFDVPPGACGGGGFGKTIYYTPGGWLDLPPKVRDHAEGMRRLIEKRWRFEPREVWEGKPSGWRLVDQQLRAMAWKVVEYPIVGQEAFRFEEVRRWPGPGGYRIVDRAAGGG